MSPLFFVSLLTAVDETSVLEVGMVGGEGMLGVHVMLDQLRSPLWALVQGKGTAWSMPVVAFRNKLAHSVVLQRGLHRDLSVLMSQQSSSAACVRYHQIGPRLARWLLMSHDRAHADHFFMTQEFLATLLEVRRFGVTSAAGHLQRSGLIEYTRGEMTILDRAGLEAAACRLCVGPGRPRSAAALKAQPVRWCEDVVRRLVMRAHVEARRACITAGRNPHRTQPRGRCASPEALIDRPPPCLHPAHSPESPHPTPSSSTSIV